MLSTFKGKHSATKYNFSVFPSHWIPQNLLTNFIIWKDKSYHALSTTVHPLLGPSPLMPVPCITFSFNMLDTGARLKLMTVFTSVQEVPQPPVGPLWTEEEGMGHFSWFLSKSMGKQRRPLTAFMAFESGVAPAVNARLLHCLLTSFALFFLADWSPWQFP